ncbi:unnamed protein product [Linum tenue]|uniref:CCHC-type domain-containing protein n=1 Tax=Linum tenue TaxID=586396 RepID=A0AAV0L210_9ROSI|nr:unnamed protein product [Linum tenue]CAI0428256.1 unnamed protein product [Linum tenue]
MDLNNETFLVTFSNDQDYLSAITGGPWVILDHYLLVHQWTPHFRSTDKPHRSVVAWVQFPDLPVHFYHREVLFAIGNLVGRTVKLDYHTETLQRGKFARIAIELDMTKPLPTRIYLDGAWQQVLYENLPQICYECGKIGHTEDLCPNRQEMNQFALVTIPNSNELAASPVTLPIASSPEPPSGYGPWMQVTRKSRRSKQSTAKSGNQINFPLGANGDSGRIGIKKGKSETNREGEGAVYKGKKEIRDEQKKIQQTAPKKEKGKEVAYEGKVVNGKKKSNGSLEWRVVDPKEKQGNLGQNLVVQASSSAQISSDVQSFKASNPVEGPNNTKIHIISVSHPVPGQKENVDPNSNTPSARQRSQKKKAEGDQNPISSKGINLKATKKPLQLTSSNKKSASLKLKDNAFPITLKAIEEFFAHSQIKENEYKQILAGKEIDVVMGDSHSASPAVTTAAATSDAVPTNLDRAISPIA